MIFKISSNNFSLKLPGTRREGTKLKARRWSTTCAIYATSATTSSANTSLAGYSFRGMWSYSMHKSMFWTVYKQYIDFETYFFFNTQVNELRLCDVKMPAKMKVRGRPKGIGQTAIGVPKKRKNKEWDTPIPFAKKHREDKTRCK